MIILDCCEWCTQRGAFNFLLDLLISSVHRPASALVVMLPLVKMCMTSTQMSKEIPSQVKMLYEPGIDCLEFHLRVTILPNAGPN